MKVEGRCHCGKIAYEAEVDPTAVQICHCLLPNAHGVGFPSRDTSLARILSSRAG